MPRTTDAAVKAIIDTQRDTTPFIATASRMVDQYALAVVNVIAANDPLLADIECYWAAHLVAVTEPRVSRKRLGETTLEYQQGKLDMGLKSTFYGQTVLDLDPTGVIASNNQNILNATFNVD